MDDETGRWRFQFLERVDLRTPSGWARGRPNPLMSLTPGRMCYNKAVSKRCNAFWDGSVE